jgi:DNA-binding HxlR family transcriptional regulator
VTAGNTPPPRLGDPVEQFLRVIKGRHKADILIRLGRGTHRFGELRRHIAGISERMLTKQLHELERDGVVARTVYPEVPPRVEYRLTPLGATMCPIIEQMWRWGRDHGRAEEHLQRAP